MKSEAGGYFCSFCAVRRPVAGGPLAEYDNNAGNMTHTQKKKINTKKKYFIIIVNNFTTHYQNTQEIY